MKKLEVGLFVIFILALVFKIFHYPGGGILVNISAMLLSVLYYFLGLFLLNGIGFRAIFKTKWYKEISIWNTLLAPALGIVFGTLFLAILFKIQMYPGAAVISSVGIFTAFPILLICIIAAFIDSSLFLKRNAFRIIFVVGLALTLVIVPKSKYIDFMYRQNPEFAELLKLREQYPNDPEINEKIRIYRYNGFRKEYEKTTEDY